MERNARGEMVVDDPDEPLVGDRVPQLLPSIGVNPMHRRTS
jgi:hypothetical protein